jgi:hypothetical protein
VLWSRLRQPGTTDGLVVVDHLIAIADETLYHVLHRPVRQLRQPGDLSNCTLGLVELFERPEVEQDDQPVVHRRKLPFRPQH